MSVVIVSLIQCTSNIHMGAARLTGWMSLVSLVWFGVDGSCEFSSV